ncbi:MAG: glucosamine-6-phosphate deaminase [Flavobacteriaceae bacterium]|nr:glucosamine-6-phosphate deaminase [Flavobacteriaceae bacterium]
MQKISYEAPGKFQESKFEKIHCLTFKSAIDGSKLVAREIANSIKSKKNKPFILGLATGSSPIGVYKELVRIHKTEKLSFKNVITFNLDEYYNISKDEPQSYSVFMNNHLFSQIDIPKKNINIPNGKTKEKDIIDYCKDYEKKIIDCGGIDFQLLGIGRTAHIGFNEPGSNKNSVTRLIALDSITRLDAANEFNGLSMVPEKAITMGIGTIMNAKRIVLLAWGHTKSNIVSKTIEGEISSSAPATFLQNHQNTTFVLDEEASADLTKFKTPWLVKEFTWNDALKKKAIVWLSIKLNKPVLKLTQRDYNKNGLASLIANQGNVYDLNIWIFNELQKTITGWPGGKPYHDDSNRPERANPPKKKVLIFSPHPDDDVISMGGTYARLIDQGHEVHVAYQTSGNIAVSDEEAIKFLDVMYSFAESDPKGIKIKDLKNKLINKKNDEADPKKIMKLKGLIRKYECIAAGRFLKLPEKNLHFLNLPFYETGFIKKNEATKNDINITVDLINKIKPHQIFAAGDLADPHGTHRICLDILFNAIKLLKNKNYMKNCWMWLYRGAWEEWEIEDIEMAIPMSPAQVLQKRNSILFHQSQKDKVMFQDNDERAFWLRAEERNKKTAKLYNKLGLAEYEAIEGFKRFYF